MSEPQTVYSDLASGATVKGRLFEGIKFFVAQRCPSRQTLIEQIRSNGGEAVPLEKNADHVIADHLRKDAPPGSISYEFVDKSLRNGRLEDPADHPVGPQLGSVRGVGSSQSKRVGRVPFTEDDNRQLCQWVSRCHSEGGYVRGNELYKQLQIANPRHTWQSWRAHYIKRLADKPVEEDSPAEAPVPALENDQPNGHSSKRKENIKKPEREKAYHSPVGTAQIEDTGVSRRKVASKKRPGDNQVDNGSEREFISETKVLPARLARDDPGLASKKKRLRDVDGVENREDRQSAARPEKRRRNGGSSHVSDDMDQSDDDYQSALEENDDHPKRGKPSTTDNKISANLVEERSRAIHADAWAERARHGAAKSKGKTGDGVASAGDDSQDSEGSSSDSTVSSQSSDPLLIPRESLLKQAYVDHLDSDIPDSAQVNRTQSTDLSAKPDSQELIRLPHQSEGHRETQDILAAETQVVDLGIAEPDDGFGDDSDASDNDITEEGGDGDEALPETSLNGSRIGANNLRPASIGSPKRHPSSNGHFRAPSTHKRESTSKSRTSSKKDLTAFELDSYIDSLIKRGYVEKDIITALKCTCMRTKLAQKILPVLKAGKGIPTSTPGVWTERDDADVEGGDAKGIKRVEQKHGPDKTNARMKYLAKWRSA